MSILRFILRFFLSLILATVLVIGGLWISGNEHLVKAVRSTYLVGKNGPTIDDHSKFENRRVETGTPQLWDFSTNFNRYTLNDEHSKTIDDWETVAFLVIQSDSILFEKYWDDYGKNSRTNSFSLAKSFTALAIGAAIKEGKIKSIDQKVGDFLPEFSKGKKAEISIKHLLQMSSGIDFGESYNNPFGFMAKTYYGTDLYDLTVEKPVVNKAGQIWKYQGGNTLLLSFIIEKACGMSLAEYFSKQFWQPIGAEEKALWTLNEAEGIERAFCCFYSNARDFARIGQLMLDYGQWNNQKLIDSTFYTQSLQPVNLMNEAGELVDHYGLHWWLGEYNNVSFHYARGIQGQYIVSIPKWDLVFVRLGHKRDSNVGAVIPKDLIDYLEMVEEIVNIEHG
jgi:CubicO group peptidase (beta-lactamase class C family)